MKEDFERDNELNGLMIKKNRNFPNSFGSWDNENFAKCTPLWKNLIEFLQTMVSIAFIIDLLINV